VRPPAGAMVCQCPTRRSRTAVRRGAGQRRLGSQSPGACFSDFALLHFHHLAVPAVAGSRSSSDGTFWIRPAAAAGSPSRVQVANVLNYCFSRPHIRFDVVCIAPDLFSTRAVDRNMANYIVSRGRCAVESISLLLFPTLASAMAAGVSPGKSGGDVMPNFEIPRAAGGAGPATTANVLGPAVYGPCRVPGVDSTPCIHSPPTRLSGGSLLPLLLLPRISRKSG